MKRTRRITGVAMMLTLMIAALLSILAISFVALNRTNLQFLSSSQDQMASTALSDTAAEYMRMRLDSQPDWGIASGSNRTLQNLLSTAGLSVYEGEQDGVVRVVGVTDTGVFQVNWQVPGADFKTYRRYNLESVMRAPQNPAAWSTEVGPLDEVSVNYSLVGYGASALLPPRSSRRALPAGCANLQVEVLTSRSRRRLDCTLKRSYLLDASAMSGGVLSVGLTGGTWNVTSQDPTTNKIRARSKIVTPNVGNLTFGAKPNAGQALAHEEILVNGDVTLDSGGNVTGVSGQALSLDPVLKASSQAATNGTFMPFDVSYPVPMLTDVQLASAPGATYSIPKGLYHFSGSNEVKYFSNPKADPGGPPDQVYTDKIPDAGGSGTAVYLKDNKFIVPGKVQVNGDVAVNGTVGHRPSMAIGYQSDGTLPKNAPAGRFEVKGNVVLRAETVGQGSLIAKSGGAVTMEGNSALSASPTQGVAVYAEGPVHLEPVPPSVTALDFKALDWDVYSAGLSGINSNTAYTYGNANTRLDPNQILGWTYGGIYSGATGMVSGPQGGGIAGLPSSIRPNQSDPFVLGDDSTITKGETRDQLVATTMTDPVVVKLQELAGQTKIYTSDAAFKKQFDAAIKNYLDGCYDNFPYDATKYPIDPGLTLGRYERLKHLLIDSEASPSSWTNSYYGAVRTDADPTSFGNFHYGETMYWAVSQLATQASQSKTPTLKGYMSGNNPFSSGGPSPLDMVFKGLIYTHENLYVKTGNHKFSVEGALVSRKGDMVIKDSTGVSFRYDPSYFDSLLNKVTSSDVCFIQMVFCSYR